jgi:RNA polymerase sigma-70 factor, ECF subfamily
MEKRHEKRDALLVRECLLGSEHAWNEFYRRYVSLVRSVVKRRLGSWHQDVEDLTQSVFAALIASLKSYDPTYSVPTFVRMISERTCIQAYRQNTAAKRSPEGNPSHRSGGEEDVHAPLPLPSDSQEDQVERSELLAVLRKAFRSLGEACRELLRLRYYEDLSYLEISKLLGATEGTLRMRAKRCLDELSYSYDRLIFDSEKGTARSRFRNSV